MCLQFEDCVDCIQALYPQFETVWMFDHSCGHDRGREDGLIAANMNTTSLKVGDIQSMVFQETDIGPYYMPEPMRSLLQLRRMTWLKVGSENQRGSVKYYLSVDNCLDFLNEKTCLMYLGERLRAEVDRSTKCHPELAGEGIEYSWGRAKGIYRRAQLSKKKGKDNFRNLVADCLSTDEGEAKGGLTPEMVRKFSRRARHYILAK